MTQTISRPPVWKIPPDIVDLGPSLLSDPWHLPSATWHPIWKQVTGRNIKVAILDTGYTDHIWGRTPIVKKSYINGQSANDGNGHGTHCFGTAIGGGPNSITNRFGEVVPVGYGVAPQAVPMVYKVLSNGGSGGSDGIAAAVRQAVDDGAQVISMSLGGGSSYAPTNANIDYAFSKGCLVNIAAGNSGYSGSGSSISWPGKYKGCLCEGAYNSARKIANFSSGGPEIEWACPGEAIISFSNTGSGLRTMSGTSMATPFGAGFLALMYEILLREGYAIWDTVDQVREFFKNNMSDMGAPGFDNRFGYGIPIVEEITKKFLDTGLVFA